MCLSLPKEVISKASRSLRTLLWNNSGTISLFILKQMTQPVFHRETRGQQGRCLKTYQHSRMRAFSHPIWMASVLLSRPFGVPLTPAPTKTSACPLPSSASLTTVSRPPLLPSQAIEEASPLSILCQHLPHHHEATSFDGAA